MPAPFETLELRARRRVGTALTEKYRLERVLGIGGMATVYLGVHRNGNRVAIKVLHPELSMEDDIRARFVREGYVANSIEHRGAVRVIDDDTADDGSVFLVMELLLGETLNARRRRHGGSLAQREVVAFGYELLAVLAAGHAKSVVHCDIKPENIFFTTERALKVLDFGIARIRDGSSSSTWTGRAMGTPAFMPPEQALDRSRDVDARTDVWATGATLFTLLSGQFVHAARSAGELVIHTATQPARALAEVAPDVPRELAAVIDRALAFDKADRWPSAIAMQEELRRAHLALFSGPLSLSTLDVPAIPDPDFSPTARAPRSDQGTLAETRPGTASITSIESGPTLPAPGGDDLITIEPAPPTPENAGARRSSPDRPSARPSLPAPPTLLAAEAPPRPPLVATPPRAARAATLGPFALIAALIAVGAFFIGSRAARAPAPTASATANASAAAIPTCSTNLECLARSQGRAAICRKDSGRCVELASEDCRVLAEPSDLADDGALWVGAMFPTAGASPPHFGPASVLAVDLARRDFKEISSGLPPARPGGRARPIGVVACDDSASHARAADHLVGDLGLPAVLGFARSKEVLDLATSHFNPRGVLALASNQATMLASIPALPGQPRLVWRTTTSAGMMVAPIAALVSEVLEPELRKGPRAVSSGEPIRVALLRIDNASGVSFSDLYVSALRYNGKSVVENGESFRQIVLPDSLAADGNTARERAVAELVAYAPHVIIGGGHQRGVIREVERRWRAGLPHRPRWVIEQTLALPELFELVRHEPAIRRRLFGVDTATSTAVVAKFVLRYNEVFSPKITAKESVTAPYDAFYLLAYAAAALGDAPITGPALARAIRRLGPPGEPVDVGPAGIYRALAALQAGRSVDLDGGTTSLDFDPETGDATASFSISCLGPPEHGDVRDLVDSGLVFDARAKKLTGALRCP